MCFRKLCLASVVVAALAASFCSAAANSTQEKPVPAVKLQSKPNDPHFDKQYYFQTMEVLESWAICQGSPDVLIGVIERGFDPEHEDFRKDAISVYKTPGMEHPKTWLHRTHGTSVVGLIAAEPNNGKGISGLAPKCKVIVAEVGTHETFRRKTAESARKWNKLFGEKVGEAIHYLVDRGCKVINCSFTTESTPRSAFEYAIEHDVVVVIGSGNFNRDRPAFPAGQLDVLSVGGVDRHDARWLNEPIEYKGREIVQGSSYGKGLTVTAPCRDLVVCIAGDEETDKRLPQGRWMDTGMGKAQKGYLWGIGKGGTSYAAPMATALVGLIRSLRPDLDCKTVIKIVEQGADDLCEEGWDKFTGYGRINFLKSLKLAQSWPTEE